MSPSASRLPERPSLEQLRKQARERLRVLRVTTEGATLADAQFALARDYGFESWPRLVHHVESINPPGLRQYEAMAATLATAYSSADFTAIREFNWEYGSSFGWDRIPERMHERLPTWFASSSRTPDLAFNDARHLVARQAGFESWDALRKSLAISPAPHFARNAVMEDERGPFFRIDHATNTIEVRPLLAEPHWETVLAVMEERGITGLVAGGMTDPVLARISRHGRLTRLNIDGSAQLTDDGLAHLARMPLLEDLDLSGPKNIFTDRGLAVLDHLGELKRFQMAWPQRVSDAGIMHLEGCDKLESVVLMGTPTGDGALRALAGKRGLRKLVTGRLLTDAALPLLHQLPVFKSWQGGEERAELMSNDSAPNHLTLDGPVTDRGLAALAGLDGLFGLNFFWHARAMTSAALASLASLPRLAMLGCEGELCDDEAMAHIAAIPKLRMLMAQGTVASDDGFIALSRSRTIENIWGRECRNLTGRGFRALAAMPALRGLGVSCARVDDASLAALPQFPALREIMPMDVPDSGFRHVGACVELERLTCMYCRDTGDIATSHVAGLAKLKQYYAGATRITDRSMEMLGNIASLEIIEMWQTPNVTDAGIAALVKLPRLRELSLDGLPGVTRQSAALFPARVRVRVT